MRPRVMMPWPQEPSNVQMGLWASEAWARRGQMKVEDLDEEGSSTKLIGPVRLQAIRNFLW